MIYHFGIEALMFAREREILLTPACWGKGFHDGDEQEQKQIRSEMMHKITYLSQDNTHRTPEIT